MKFRPHPSGLAVPRDLVDEVWADDKSRLIVSLKHGARRVRQQVRRFAVLPDGRAVEVRRNDAQTVVEIETDNQQDAVVRPTPVRIRTIRER